MDLAICQSRRRWLRLPVRFVTVAADIAPAILPTLKAMVGKSYGPVMQPGADGGLVMALPKKQLIEIPRKG